MAPSSNKRNSTAQDKESGREAKRAKIVTEGDDMVAVERDSDGSASTATLESVPNDVGHGTSEIHSGGQNSVEVITPSTRGYFESELCERLNKLNTMYSKNSAIATLRTVTPADLYWGPSSAGRSSDESQFLYLNGKKFTLWAVAELLVANLYFKGKPQRKPGVMFRPLLVADFKMAEGILCGKSFPRKVTMDDREGFWASRWMGSNSDGDSDIPEFTRVYDALSEYHANKTKMDRYDGRELKKGDIVLVEMFVNRWTPKDDEEGSDEDSARNKKKKSSSWREQGRTKKTWKRWTVDFRLDAVSVIYPGSDYWAEDQKTDDEFDA